MNYTEQKTKSGMKLYDVHGILMSGAEQMAFDKFIADNSIAMNTKTKDERLGIALDFIERYNYNLIS